jgi:uncharacterized membrane protein YdjX (TVP38/TMEM64 family)
VDVSFLDPEALPSMAPAVGLGLLFLVMVVQVIVPPIPAELIVVSAGRTYGLVSTTLVAGAGLWLGSLAVFAIGWWLRQRFDRFFAGPRVGTILRRVRRYGAWLLWVRILPYNPSDAISYAAGILRLDVRAFLAITAVTSVVRCLTLAWLGTTLTDLRTVLQAGAVLAASAAVAHYLVYRHRDPQNPEPHNSENDDEGCADEG